MWQGLRYTAENAFEVAVDHLIPVLDLEHRQRREGHQPSGVDHHVDSAKRGDSQLHQLLDPVMTMTLTLKLECLSFLPFRWGSLDVPGAECR